MPTECYWIYILHCDNDSYYTGYTNDLMRRYQNHIDGKCKYTRSFKPLYIAKAWKLKGTKSTAMKIERLIKKLSKAEKNQLLVDSKAFEKMWKLAAVKKLNSSIS